MDKHSKKIEKYSGSLKELAEDIGNLHYESLAEFLRHLSTKLDNDMNKDMAAGRVKLATELEAAEFNIWAASGRIQLAWLISQPYMK